MATLAIFILGLFVSILTFTAALLVGLQEAADSGLSKAENLAEFEKKIVGRDENE